MKENLSCYPTRSIPAIGDDTIDQDVAGNNDSSDTGVYDEDIQFEP